MTSPEPVSDDVPTTTSTTSTSTVAPVKETIPLAEEDINPGLKLMGALDDFNTCLAAEGYQWIGFPNADLGANDPVNQPGYLEALQFCNSRTGIANAYQDFQTSRSDMAPDEIRQANEDFIELADCLRSKGWDIGQLSRLGDAHYALAFNEDGAIAHDPSPRVDCNDETGPFYF